MAGIGRTLIPRFFRSIFEGGVTDLHWELRHAKENFHAASVSLDCDQATMVTQHGKPMFTKVINRTVAEFLVPEWGILSTMYSLGGLRI